MMLYNVQDLADRFTVGPSSCAHATVFLGSRRIVCTLVVVVNNPGSSPVLRNAADIASAPRDASETGFAEDSAT